MSLVHKFIPGNEINNQLYKAIYSADLEKLNQILDSIGLSYSPSWAEGHELLLTAIDCKHIDVAKLLVEKGCKLEGQIGSRSAFHLAVRQGNPELLAMLLDRDENAITRTEHGDTLLHVAIAEGQEDLVRVLLQYKADCESRNGGGMTPLQLASVRGHVEIIEQILASEADTESKDKSGKTSLFLAVSSGHKDAVKTLLNYGASCKCRSINGHTPLLDATSKGYLEIVRDLLSFGADFNEKNNFGQTPLHIACMQKNKSMICALLNAGSDVNAIDFCGMVPSDAIVKKVTPCSTFFEDSSISYLLGKHFLRLKIAGFHLNQKNRAFFDFFYNMYCNEIVVGNIVFSSTSNVIHSTMKTCADEISTMKNMKSEGGLVVYDIFAKFKDPLNLITENEIKFLQSIDLDEKLPSYAVIMRNCMKHAKLRNQLIICGQEWLSFIINLSQLDIPVLPEEMRIKVLSFINNDELKHFVCSCEEIYRDNNFQD